MKIKGTAWEDSRSHIVPEEDHAAAYNGSLVLNECEMRFSLQQQKHGAYLYRGTISAISPATGRVINITLPAKEDSDAKEKKASINLYTNLDLCEDIKAYVEDRAFALYSMFAETISRLLHGTARKETITPALAYSIHGHRYIDYAHPKASENTKTRHYKKLSKLFSRMPHNPMAEFSLRQTRDFLRENGVHPKTTEELRGFWRYCLEQGICLGADPFPVQNKRKHSAEEMTGKAIRPDELSESTQVEVYKTCLEDPSGPNCGMALMLWANTASKEACSLKWKQIHFHEEDPDLVSVVILKSEYAGATHIYTRPVFPQAARILKRRYMQLRERYSVKALDTMNVVCPLSSDREAMSADDLIKYTSTLLRVCGVLNGTFAELREPKKAVSRKLAANTYRANLVRRCGLEDDPYTVKYLCGESLLGNTSSDNYISFSDDDALLRLYTIMRVLQPVEEYAETMQHDVLDSGRHLYRIFPKKTNHCAGAKVSLRLAPGEGFELKCLHGLAGNIMVREAGADGKPKRKSRRKNAS